jgi:hypothetical protein
MYLVTVAKKKGMSPVEYRAHSFVALWDVIKESL